MTLFLPKSFFSQQKFAFQMIENCFLYFLLKSQKCHVGIFFLKKLLACAQVHQFLNFLDASLCFPPPLSEWRSIFREFSSCQVVSLSCLQIIAAVKLRGAGSQGALWRYVVIRDLSPGCFCLRQQATGKCNKHLERGKESGLTVINTQAGIGRCFPE